MTSEQPLRDKEGYLCDMHLWSPELAEQIAQEENIRLTAEHWEVVGALRVFYAEFQMSPAMRPLIKYLRHQTGSQKIDSIYLLQLFPESPAKLAAKIAGLPKPDNCL